MNLPPISEFFTEECGEEVISYWLDFDNEKAKRILERHVIGYKLFLSCTAINKLDARFEGDLAVITTKGKSYSLSKLDFSCQQGDNVEIVLPETALKII